MREHYKAFATKPPSVLGQLKFDASVASVGNLVIVLRAEPSRAKAERSP